MPSFPSLEYIYGISLSLSPSRAVPMLNESKIHWGFTYSRPCCNLMHTEGRIHNPAHVEKQWGLNRRLQRKEKRRTFDHLCCLSESQPKTLVASRIHCSNWLQLIPTLTLATTRTHIKRTHRPVNNLMRNGFAWLPFASEWRGEKRLLEWMQHASATAHFL